MEENVARHAGSEALSDPELKLTVLRTGLFAEGRFPVVAVPSTSAPNQIWDGGGAPSPTIQVRWQQLL